MADEKRAKEKEIEREINDGIENLIRRLQQLQSLDSASDDDGATDEEERGVRVITLVGHNEGATMNLQGLEDDDDDYRNYRTPCAELEDDEDGAEDEDSSAGTQGGGVKAIVNSNVQSVNNSILFESSCDDRDPGVHLELFNRPVDVLHNNQRNTKRSRSRGALAVKELERGVPSSNLVGLHKNTVANSSHRGKSLHDLFSGSSEEDW